MKKIMKKNNLTTTILQPISTTNLVKLRLLKNQRGDLNLISTLP
jgi:hypothetical protein